MPVPPAPPPAARPRCPRCRAPLGRLGAEGAGGAGGAPADWYCGCCGLVLPGDAGAPAGAAAAGAPPEP